jgi:hypothetical protein
LLNTKKLILWDASVGQHRDSLQTTFLVFPVGVSIRKPFAEPTFEQATYTKNISPLNQCPLLLQTDLELYGLS